MNFTDKKKKVRIETEIEGYTEKFTKAYTIP
jgi:hypothetical protein